jgi:phenylacetate-coenzyme A ligase PaaK-like adenylate-forming protein
MAFHLLETLSDLWKNLFLERRKLRELQWKKLKPLLKHSYENVPFYHRKFDQAKIKPSDIRKLEDLGKIPLTTKSELQRSSLESLTAKNVNLEKCLRTCTSGSTGMPLTLFLDKRTVDHSGRLWARMYLRNGLRIWDRMAVIRDPNYFPRESWIRNLQGRLIRRKYISSFEDTETHIRIIKQYCPEAVKGYSSSLGEIGRVLKDRGQHIGTRLVFTGGAVLTKLGRSLINESFGVDPLDNYGTMEFSLVGWECKKHSGYHINADSVVVEFIDGGEDVATGEQGEVICTGLTNYAMPLIRYKLHDVAIPIDGECPCGVKLPLLKCIEGRLNDFLIASDGRRIPPSRFYPFPFDDYIGIKQFKVTQVRSDRLVIHLMVEKNSFDFSSLYKARLRIQELFGADMRVDFDIVKKIDFDKGGKMRPISRMFQ